MMQARLRQPDSPALERMRSQSPKTPPGAVSCALQGEQNRRCQSESRSMPAYSP